MALFTGKTENIILYNDSFYHTTYIITIGIYDDSKKVVLWYILEIQILFFFTFVPRNYTNIISINGIIYR